MHVMQTVFLNFADSTQLSHLCRIYASLLRKHMLLFMLRYLLVVSWPIVIVYFLVSFTTSDTSGRHFFTY